MIHDLQFNAAATVHKDSRLKRSQYAIPSRCRTTTANVYKGRSHTLL